MKKIQKFEQLFLIQNCNRLSINYFCLRAECAGMHRQRVNRRGDVYFVNMIDEDTHECVQFMIRDKKIYTLREEDDNDSEPSAIEDIFRNETDSVIKMIYGE